MEKPGGKSNSGSKSPKVSRDERLAVELRANLKRRKAAARVRAEDPDSGDETPEAPGSDVMPPDSNKATA
jgi:hypothetical protein